MGDKFRNFMRGRYGFDQLNRGLVVLSLVVLILGIFLGRYVTLLAFLLLCLAYYRAFSKKIAKRYSENQCYLRYANKARGFLWQQKKHQAAKKNHRFYKCPNCKQKVRVPKGVGKIAIRCPKCQEEFVKKT